MLSFDHYDSQVSYHLTSTDVPRMFPFPTPGHLHHFPPNSSHSLQPPFLTNADLLLFFPSRITECSLSLLSLYFQGFFVFVFLEIDCHGTIMKYFIVFHRNF